jgi:thiamine kinase-like enzyme
MSTDPNLAAVLMKRVLDLPCWRGPVSIQVLTGGLSNRNYRVHDDEGDWVVRLAGEIPEHGIRRANDIASSRAAAAAGIAPSVRYSEANVLVLRFVAGGRTLTDADIREPAMFERVAALLRLAHRTVGRKLRGPMVAFSVFHALRDYAGQLESTADSPDLTDLMMIADRLEAAIGPTEQVFGHGDLLPSNLIDDGRRLWLIDWEYAGYNTPLFDLGNLSANARFDGAQTEAFLTAYFGRPPSAETKRGVGAMKVASLLREALWARVAKRHRRVPIDFDAYAAAHLALFETAHRAFVQELG